MVSETHAADESWGSLVDEPPAERERAMLARYNELSDMTEEQQYARLLSMARAEYALPDDKLRVFTLSRLNTLLSLEEDRARNLMAVYDRVMREMPGQAAMRRVTLVQALSRELPAESEAKLRELAPAVFVGAPPLATVLDVQPAPAAKPPRQKRAWWAFWKKSA